MLASLVLLGLTMLVHDQVVGSALVVVVMLAYFLAMVRIARRHGYERRLAAPALGVELGSSRNALDPASCEVAHERACVPRRVAQP